MPGQNCLGKPAWSELQLAEKLQYIFLLPPSYELTKRLVNSSLLGALAA